MKTAVVAGLLAAVVGAGIRWGTFVAGGSDSYCYAHGAERWASLLRQGFGGQALRLQIPEPLALQAPWPDAPLTFAPAGHVPSSTVPGAIVPICAAGLSIAMAPALLIGGRDAIFYVVPLFGGLLVWATFVLGGRFGTRAGLSGALLVAASPVFLYQLMQPMSDVPAAALWMTALAVATSMSRRGPLIAGLATSGAVLIRPNLVPLAIPIALYLLLRPEQTWRKRIHAAAVYAVSMVPGCLAVAAIQWAFYGSPLNSGYGTLDAIFSVGNVLPNASRYLTWLTQVHTPVWLLAIAALFLLPGALTRLLAGFIVVNAALYLPYQVFEDWSYLRFLLPAIAVLLVLVAASIDVIATRLAGPQSRTRPTYAGRVLFSRPGVSSLIVAVVVVCLALLYIREGEARLVFRLQALEARYARGGDFVARRLPANAIVMTRWQSGSVRFYSGRKTVLWDSLDAVWLERAIDDLRRRGFEPYLLFERWEEPLFRQRFAASRLGALDWPPIAEIATLVRVYHPADRERYFRGEPVPTEYVR